jgi:hypothetical protein
VKAKVKPGMEKALLEAIESGSLGQGSVAGDEYLDDMQKARITEDGVCAWVEVCFCSTPLEEERPYWEGYFDLLQVKDAHSRKCCRDANGTEPWACCDCDCTRKLDRRLEVIGQSFLNSLKEEVTGTDESVAQRGISLLRSSRLRRPDSITPRRVAGPARVAKIHQAVGQSTGLEQGPR